MKTTPLLPDEPTHSVAGRNSTPGGEKRGRRSARKRKAPARYEYALVGLGVIGLALVGSYLVRREASAIPAHRAPVPAVATEPAPASAPMQPAPVVPVPLAEESPANPPVTAPVPAEPVAATAPSADTAPPDDALAARPAPAQEIEPGPDPVLARIVTVRVFDEANFQGTHGEFGRAAAVLETWVAAHPGHPERAALERQIARFRAAELVPALLLQRPSAIIGARIPAGVIMRVAAGKIICQAPAPFGVIDVPVEWPALGEATRLQLLQRADAANQTFLAPAHLVALGNFAGARALLRADSADSAGREEMRDGLEEAEDLANDLRVLAAMDEVQSAINRQAYAYAEYKLDETMKANLGHPFLAGAYASQIQAWRLQIAGAPSPTAIAAVTPSLEVRPGDSYPGLPVFSLSSAMAVGDPDRKQLAQAAQWAAVSGEWTRHFTALLTGLVTAANQGPWYQHPQNLDRILQQASPRLALEQARFIKAVSADALKDFCQDELNREFVGWLLAHPKPLGAFNDALKPQDKTRNALLQWRVIWNDDPENREKLASLAIACALVFDVPVKINPAIFSTDEKNAARVSASANGLLEASALNRYRFYRDSAKRGSLRTSPADMQPWELVWVVDAPVPESELVWAQKHVNYPRRNWSEAYGHIRYRTNRTYEAYTLAQIEKEGGICGDQAYFAAISAKANGIPAMIIGGKGDRGGHAWFGFLVGRNEWNLSTGRYDDHYAAGSTHDPQTGLGIKEHELRQLTDPARRTADYERSEGLVSFATLLSDPSQRALAALACSAALTAAPKNYAAWNMKLDQLAEARVATTEWLRETTRMRVTFQEFSDLVEEINLRDLAYLTAAGDTTGARKLVRLQTARLERKDETRTDLILDSVYREVDLAEKAGDSAAIPRIFHEALRSKGDEMVGFRSIADHFYAWAKVNGQGPEVVRELITFFDRTYAEPVGDVSGGGAYRSALARLSAMAGEQGLDRQQRSLDRRTGKLGERADKAKKAQARADR